MNNKIKELYEKKQILLKEAEKEYQRVVTLDHEILDNRVELVKIEYEIKEIREEITLMERYFKRKNFMEMVMEVENNSRNS